MQNLMRTIRQLAAASICLMVVGAMAGTNTVFADLVPDPTAFAECKHECCIHVGARCNANGGCALSCDDLDCNESPVGLRTCDKL